VHNNILPSLLQAVVTESWDRSAMFVDMIGPDVPGYYNGRGKPGRADGKSESAQAEHKITVTKEARRFSIQRHFQQMPDSITA
jgi:hypothetical protein